VAWGQSYHLSQKLLVDVAEDVGAEDGELVGRFRVVEVLDNRLEGLVVYCEGVAQGVGLEVEEAAVVSGVGLAEELEEATVAVLTVDEGL